MKNAILGVVLGGMTMYFYGFIYWGLSPLPYQTLERTNGDEAAQQALREHFPRVGTYYVPGMYNEEAELNRLHEAGPVAMVYVTSVEGRPVYDSVVMGKGVVLCLVVSGLLWALLAAANPAGYGASIKLIAIAAVAAAVMFPIGDTVWWYLPLAWKLHQAFYAATAWIVAGLVLARFRR